VTVPNVVRTDHRVLPARLERIGWYHPEWTAALVALEAWLLLIAHDRLRPTERAVGWVHAQGEWAAMATAMMLPAALPTLRQVALRSKWHRRQRSAAIFGVSFLAVWLLFGAVAVSAARVARVPAGAGRPLAATLLVAAGWELTPLKRRSLRACHRTMPLAPDGRSADAACARWGARYGWAGLGAGWALMLPMAVAGHSRLAVMVLLTAVVGTEEVLVKGTRLVWVAALALVATAAVVAFI
jgi:predicted metal-binding membrane protein